MPESHLLIVAFLFLFLLRRIDLPERAQARKSQSDSTTTILLKQRATISCICDLQGEFGLNRLTKIKY